ncbi:DUF222 domain-containing protein [Nocardia xishanensis]|uniref:DUF222 domain-containing protein n=1 Tax=Nocardia xishanensis TaxID=238964 RepID=UPI0008361D14|nr:DUF222 domain-containing protein [Nocardia xishanensis]
MADESTETDSDLIAGESRADLVRAMSYVHTESGPDGEYILNGDLPPEVAPPFVRAVMRIEAELLLHDAELVTLDDEEPRTQEQRRADAFVALVMRLDNRR